VQHNLVQACRFQSGIGCAFLYARRLYQFYSISKINIIRGISGAFVSVHLDSFWRVWEYCASSKLRNITKVSDNRSTTLYLHEVSSNRGGGSRAVLCLI
jgi:hypothetical protein